MGEGSFLFAHSPASVDGRNPAPAGTYGKPLFVGSYRGIILSEVVQNGFRPSSVHLTHPDSPGGHPGVAQEAARGRGVGGPRLHSAPAGRGARGRRVRAAGERHARDWGELGGAGSWGDGRVRGADGPEGSTIFCGVWGFQGS